jgi:hypothetical protein
MKTLITIESASSKVEWTKLFIELIVFISGFIGIKDKNMLVNIGLIALGLLVVYSLFSIIRLTIIKVNQLSFIRVFLKSDDWKRIRKQVSLNMLNLVGHPDKNKIHRQTLLEEAVIYILKNKKNLTYNKVSNLIQDLIEDDNLTEFEI